MSDRNTVFTDSFEDEGEDFNLMEYLMRYMRYWYLFPIFLFISLSLAVLYLKTSQQVYLTRAVLLIKDQKKGIGGSSSDILQELSQFGGNKLVENEIEVFKSQALMQRVISDLGLGITYTTQDGLRTKVLYNASPVIVRPDTLFAYAYEEPMEIKLNGNQFSINDEEKEFSYGKKLKNSWGVFTVLRGIPDSTVHEVNVVFKEERSLLESILKNLEVKQPNVKSTVLELTYEDPSTVRGKDILNKLLDVYVKSSLNDKNIEVSNTLKFIENRLDLITGELVEVEKDVESYKRNQSLTDISAESTIFLESIKDNDKRLNEVNNQLNVLNDVERYIQSNLQGVVAPATYMISDPVLVSLLTKFNEMVLEKERLALTTKENNPLMQTLTNQVEATRRAINENIRSLKNTLTVTQQSLEGINKRFTTGLRSIPQKEREYISIKRQQTIKEGLYLYLLQKREETALTYAASVTDSRIIDQPVSTVKPIKPKSLLVMAGAGVAGFAIPLLLINLLFLLNNTVQSREQIEKASNATILGEIGVLKNNKNKPEEGVIQMANKSAVAEQFRALRTNLQYLGNSEKPVRKLMFTSTIGGEGKSFVSINLGASLAFSDKKVVLIGLDLRKPTLHERLNVSNFKGASTYLIGQGKLEDLVVETKVHPNLHVLPSGPIPPNPSELLSNGRLETMIEELSKKYDYVLVDAPPYGLVTDAAIIADYVEATLYLVRYNYTILPNLKRIGELKKAGNFPKLSVVYNGVNYGSGYGYGYGYGYYTEAEQDTLTKAIRGVRKWIRQG